MYRFLLTKQWLVLTLICLILVPSFYELSQWQWRRLELRREFNTAITSNQAKPPREIAELLDPTASTIAQGSQWRTVTMSGYWDTEHQVLVRRRSLNTHVGFWVATPFVTSATTIIVVRGWHEAGLTSRDTPTIANPSSELSQVTVRIRDAQARTKPVPRDLPLSQVDLLVPAEIYPELVVTNAYGELESCTPVCSEGLVLLSAPTISEGPHQSYAFQWIIFALLTVVGWGIFFRNALIAQASPPEN
ncbi:MAG: hypothetical protein F2839_04675 [Actinobacteria bacterium]|uniref:Unannotated protein n=1 Tax=freshwater metagenome TaxID=449393 RepID=A0A6J5ZBI0_9ZZZZ|nr:hypothetical protein [Actinomycetota bacterium]